MMVDCDWRLIMSQHSQRSPASPAPATPTSTRSHFVQIPVCAHTSSRVLPPAGVS